MVNKTLSLCNALTPICLSTPYGDPKSCSGCVQKQQEIRIAPALSTLDGLVTGGKAGSFDFAFIDADKINYLAYYERALTLVRTGGLIAINNTLWGEQVIDKKSKNDDTQAIMQFNDRLWCDLRIHLSLLPIGDGLTLAPQVVRLNNYIVQ